MAAGFYITNQTENRVNFVAMDGKFKFLLAPAGERNDTVFISKEYSSDPTILRLLQRETVTKVADGAAKVNETVAATSAERSAAETALLENAEDVASTMLVERPCSQPTAKGEPCKGKGVTTLGDFEAGVPVLCHIHSRAKK
jgi:hypothetical protein